MFARKHEENEGRRKCFGVDLTRAAEAGCFFCRGKAACLAMA